MMGEKLKEAFVYWAYSHRWWVDPYEGSTYLDPDSKWIITSAKDRDSYGNHRYHIQIQQEGTIWLVGDLSAYIWALAVEFEELIAELGIIESEIWRLILDNYYRPDSRESLSVVADYLLNQGHPFGEILSFYLVGLLQEKEATILEMLQKATLDEIFRRSGGYAWAPRKTKVGDLGIIDGRTYEVKGDVWTNKKSNRKYVLVRPTDRKPSKRAPIFTRDESDPTFGNQDERMAYRGVGPQGDLLARREQRERDRTR